ncbi:MAG: NAD(P)H-hydrate epimerase [Neolewinella sp.]|jgi:NAD(P)H-hydrate repair Nnr-like enzyme with NAD(P)H-hydrate dehydratase domain
MGTGGTGDALTGILTGLLAQGYAPVDAACLGVFLHGLAGDIAAAEIGQESLLAETS